MAIPIPPLFKDLPRDVIDQILAKGTRYSRKGSVQIISEGDEGISFYIVLSGKLKVHRDSADGKETIFKVLHAGDHFGELALLDDKPRSASVTTLEPSEVLVLKKADFWKGLANYPELARQFLRSLSEDNRRLTDQVDLLASRSVFERLRAFLSDEARSVGGLMIVKYKHREIASHIGCTRERVSEIMKDLAQGGYVEKRRGHIVLLKELPRRY